MREDTNNELKDYAKTLKWAKLGYVNHDSSGLPHGTQRQPKLFGPMLLLGEGRAPVQAGMEGFGGYVRQRPCGGPEDLEKAVSCYQKAAAAGAPRQEKPWDGTKKPCWENGSGKLKGMSGRPDVF